MQIGLFVFVFVLVPYENRHICTKNKDENNNILVQTPPNELSEVSKNSCSSWELALVLSSLNHTNSFDFMRFFGNFGKIVC